MAYPIPLYCPKPGALRAVRAFVRAAAALAVTVGAARAQPLVSSDTARVVEVRIAGPTVLPMETLLASIRTQPNRRFLNLPGATWWLWLYRTGERRGGRLGQALQDLGEPPAYVDLALVSADAERLRMLLTQEGYRRAAVTARLDTLRRSGHETPVRVVFAIAPGPVTRIERVVVDAPAPLAERLARSSLLVPKGPVEDGAVRVFRGASFVPRETRYSERLLVDERQRILATLRDDGYAAVTADSVRAFLDGAPEDTTLALALRVRPGERYRFGGFDAEIDGPVPSALPRTKVWKTGDDPRLAVTVTVANDRRLRPTMVRDALGGRPGASYRASALADTKRRLDASGVFAFTDLVAVWTDTFRVDGVPYLPHRLVARTHPRHSLRLDAFVLQRTGVLQGSDGEVGTGIGASYDNLNLFGRGEAFRLRVAGSVAGTLDGGLSSSRQFETSASVAAPYAAAPFGVLLRPLAARGVRTTASLSLLTARRDELRLVLRARLGLRLRYDLAHTPALSSAFDLPDAALSNPDTLDGFGEAFLSRLPATLDPVERERLLEDYTRPSSNAAFRYTLRYSTTQPIQRRSGMALEASVGAGGLLEAFADRYMFTPDTVSSTVPGPGGGELVYRPYVRFSVDARRYWPVTPITVVAVHASAGVAVALGASGLVPFDRRFYAGGASSVRGWSLRELGPGSASAERGVANILGGDVRLEASAEVRRTLVPLLFGAEWIGASFVDAGNVWLRAGNPGASTQGAVFRLPDALGELGVGTGLGLRVAYPFLVLRFDVATRLLDPALPGTFMPYGLRPTFYFGLGHAF